MRAGWPRSYVMDELSDENGVAAGASQGAPSVARAPSVITSGRATPSARAGCLPASRFSDGPRVHDDSASRHEAARAARVRAAGMDWRRTGGRMVLSRPLVGNVDEVERKFIPRGGCGAGGAG